MHSRHSVFLRLSSVPRGILLLSLSLLLVAAPALASEELWSARILTASRWSSWIPLGAQDVPQPLPAPQQLLARLPLIVPPRALAVEMRGSRKSEEGEVRRVSLWRARPKATLPERIVDAESLLQAPRDRKVPLDAEDASVQQLLASASTISGKLLYRDRIFDLAGYTGATRTLPLRHLRVELTRAGDDSLLASTASGSDGSFLLSFEPLAPTDVKIRILSEVEGLTGVDARVLDQAGPGGDLSQAQPLVREVVQITSLGPGVSLDLQSLLLSDNASNDTLGAFNLLDCLLDAVELLQEPAWLGAAPAQMPPAIWAPASTQISSSYQDGVFRIASPGGGDDDSWSDSVLLAQVGRWFLETYGRSDLSLGFTGLDLDRDPLSAFGDGAAIVFGSLVRQHRALTRLDDDGNPADDEVSTYIDLTFPPPLGFPGAAQDGFDLETRELSYGDSAAVRGQRSVSNVAAMLWDLVDDTNTPDGSPGDDDLRQDAAVDGAARFFHVLSVDLPALPGSEAISYEDFHEAWRSDYAEDPALFQIAVTQGRTALFDDALEPDDDWQQLPLDAAWVQPEPLAGAGVVIGELFLGDSDWVEITNAGESTVSLGGYTVIAHRNDFSTGSERVAAIPSGFQLGPGRSVVLHEGGSAANDTGFDLFFPGWSIPWKEGADGACTLLNAAATPLDFVRWDGSQSSLEPVPSGLSFTGTLQTPSFGSTLGRDSLATDTDTAADFAQREATPRAPNASFLKLHSLRPRGDTDHLRLSLAVDDLCYVLAAAEREAPLSRVTELDTLGTFVQQADTIIGAQGSTLLQHTAVTAEERVFRLQELPSVHIATAVSWGAWIPWGAVVVRAVQNLHAQALLQSVELDPVQLSWTNDGVYDSLQITLDAAPLVTVPDTTQSLNTSVPSGHHLLSVVPWFADVAGPSRSASVYVGSTPSAVQTGFEPGDSTLFALKGFTIIDQNFSGTKALLDHANPLTTYAPNDTAVAELIDPVDLTSESVLNFTHAAQLALDGDFAAVELSLDDGGHWQEIARYLGSDHTGQDGADWSDVTLQPGDWIHESLDLSAYAGERARIRFRRISDASVESIGWILDDVFFGTKRGNSIWVSNEGSDDFGCGLKERPLQSIAAAVAESALGDTLRLAAGSYSGTVELLLDGSLRPVNVALPPGRSLVGMGSEESVIQVPALGTGIYAGPLTGWTPSDSAVVRGVDVQGGSRGLRLEAGFLRAMDISFQSQGTAVLVQGGDAALEGALLTKVARAVRLAQGGLLLRNCTVVDVPRAVFVQATADSATIESNIFSRISESAIEVEAGAPPPAITCNDFYALFASMESFLGVDDPRGMDGNLAEPPYFCDPDAGDYHLSQESPLLDVPACGLMGAFGAACSQTAVAAPPLAASTRLLENEPNPFNPSTRIRFVLARAGVIDLRIFDTRGRMVRSLLAGKLAAGDHTVDWDGRDSRGQQLASGVYHLRLKATGVVSTRPLVLLK